MIWQRMKNLWALSEYKIPPFNQSGTYPPGTKVVTGLIKEPGKAEIIKRNPVDPIDEIVNSL